MSHAKCAVVVVHGIGSGTGEGREHFSDDLKKLVAKECAGTDFNWLEATWESVNDKLDEVITDTVVGLLDVYIDEAVRKAKEAEEKRRNEKVPQNARWYVKFGRWVSSFAGKAMAEAPAAGMRKAKELLPLALDALIDLPLYLGARQGATMRQVVRSKIEEATKADAVEGVVLVGHSLGSVVAFDVVKEYVNEGAAQKIKALVTMGSPLEWVTNIRRALGDDANSGDIADIEWLNFYDEQDPVPLRRKLNEAIFAGVENIPCPSGKTLIKAHCAYWQAKLCAEKIAALIR